MDVDKPYPLCFNSILLHATGMAVCTNIFSCHAALGGSLDNTKARERSLRKTGNGCSNFKGLSRPLSPSASIVFISTLPASFSRLVSFRIKPGLAKYTIRGMVHARLLHALLFRPYRLAPPIRRSYD